MTRRNSPEAMWAEACALLDRAERLQREFFQPRARGGPVVWEPPVDVFEADHALRIIVALPGVPADRVELFVDGSTLVVSGVRSLPRELRDGTVRRMEIPAGRFERRIGLPPGRFELIEQRLADGCLTLTLRRI